MLIRCRFSSSKVAFNEKDRVIDGDVRTNFVDPSNLISFSQVSNALHVLMGARPAPVNRETFHKRNEYIDDLANNAWVRVDNKYSYISKDGKECYYYEFTQGKKNYWKSRSELVTNEIGEKNDAVVKGFLTWNSLRKRYYYLNRDRYVDIISTFERLSNMSFTEIKSKYTLYGFVKYLLTNSENYKELVDLGKRVKFDKFATFKDASDFNSPGCKTNLAILTINTNPTYKISLNGEIIYEIEDEDAINTLYSGNKMATFLDGGMIEIVEIGDSITVDDDYLEKEDLKENGFRLVTKN